MLAALPILSFLTIYLAVRRSNLFVSSCWRGSFLFSSLICGTLIALSTEALSLFKSIHFGSIVLLWLITLLAAGIILFRLCQKNPYKFSFNPALFNFTVGEIICLLSILVFMGITALIAWVAPPNTWDSMTYHMARVMHWIQNKSLAHYPTNIMRQLSLTPFAEICIMHVQILTKSDRLANFVQWLSMVGSIIGVSLIAKQFKANRFVQIVAALIAVTIPMGILQATSTQNDYAISFWLLCFVYFFLLLKENYSLMKAIAVGVSFGLALFTKPTAYIFVFPFILWIVASMARKSWRKLLYALLMIGSIALIINIAHYGRNMKLSGDPLGTKTKVLSKAATHTFTPQAIYSQFILHAGTQMGTPSKKINGVMEKIVLLGPSMLNIDINEYAGGHKFHISPLPFDEDHAGNFIHFILMGICILLFLFSGNLKKRSALGIYLGCVVVSFILMSTFLKWTPYKCRYHLSFFLLYAPFMAITLNGFTRKPKNWLVLLTALFLVATSFPWLLKNRIKPVLGKHNIFTLKREAMYFMKQPHLLTAYEKTAEYISKGDCRTLALSSGEDHWEYPLWVKLNESIEGDFRLEHVKGKNLSFTNPRIKSPENYRPCALIDLTTKATFKHEINGETFIRTRDYVLARIFEIDSDGKLLKKNLMRYYYKAKIATAKTFGRYQKLGVNQVFQRRSNKEFEHLKNEYLEARMVDIDQMEQIYAGFRDNYNNHLLQGLFLSVEGYKAGNIAQFKKGQTLIFLWLSWLREHEEGIDQALRLM